MYERFAYLCYLKGISIKQACDALLISPSAVSQWKTRDCLPRGEQAVRIANFFNCTTDYVLGRTPFETDERRVTPGEDRIIIEFDKLNKMGRARLIEYAQMLADKFPRDF